MTASKGRDGVVQKNLVAKLLGETPTRTSALRALVPAAESLKRLRLPPRAINKAAIGADPLAEPVAWPYIPSEKVRKEWVSPLSGPCTRPHRQPPLK